MTTQVNAARAKRKSELAQLKSRSAADERVAMVRIHEVRDATIPTGFQVVA
jgi:hypothetical protein